MFTEYAPEVQDKTQEKVDKADQDINSLTANARKVQFEADSLALARDLAQVGKLYNEMMKTEQAARQERMVHLRGQNVIGASIVGDFMANHMAVHAGPAKDLISLAERVLCCQNWGFKVVGFQRYGLMFFQMPCFWNQCLEMFGHPCPDAGPVSRAPCDCLVWSHEAGTDDWEWCGWDEWRPINHPQETSGEGSRSGDSTIFGVRESAGVSSGTEARSETNVVMLIDIFQSKNQSLMMMNYLM